VSPVERDLEDGARWEFDSEVATVFDEMLERSIPQYQTMRNAVFELGRRYVRPGTAIVDLGCARGEALAPFVREFGHRNAYVGLELSEPMVAAARERFADAPDVSIVKADLRDGLPKLKASVVLSVLTLQFTPINYRHSILSDVAERLVPGGALLLVEKVLGSSAATNDRFVDLYHDAKRRTGYTDDEIERKRLALEGVLVPVTAGWNEDLLLSAGFAAVDCFWRWMNFAGWLAVK